MGVALAAGTVRREDGLRIVEPPLFILMVLGLLDAGCNTMEGVGKDIASGGEAIGKSPGKHKQQHVVQFGRVRADLQAKGGRPVRFSGNALSMQHQ